MPRSRISVTIRLRRSIVDAVKTIVGESLRPVYVLLEGDQAEGGAETELSEEELIERLKSEFDAEEFEESENLDAEEARRNSPLWNLPASAAKLIIAYGSDELAELKRQSREFAAARSGRGLPREAIEVADCHHYAVPEQLARPDGVLAKALAVSAGADPS